MEYGELADLVHEYNPTVISNRSTYKDQKNKNLNDIYDDYMKDIDDIWDQADSADNDIFGLPALLRRTFNKAGRQQQRRRRYGKNPVRPAGSKTCLSGTGNDGFLKAVCI